MTPVFWHRWFYGDIRYYDHRLLNSKDLHALIKPRRKGLKSFLLGSPNYCIVLLAIKLII